MPKRVPIIRLRGIRHNNLKNFDLGLPKGRLIVITGLSGSGKSSLAFDTLYAEGQRRYIETFSPYARQFFDRMDKPQVDKIEGIPPAIAIEQRNSVKTTRSTVGTMTEICDYMKAVWLRLAILHCRGCGQPVRKDTPQLIWEQLSADPGMRSRERLITFDLPLSDKLSLEESLRLVSGQGYQRLLLDGQVVRVEEAVEHCARHSQPSVLTVVQDRLTLKPEHRARFVEACEQAYHFGKGTLAVFTAAVSDPPAGHGASGHHFGAVPRRFSQRLHCAACDLEYREASPALFSFNHPLGACPACRGFGRTIAIDYDLAIPDRTLSLAQGAIKPWQSGLSAECQTDLKRFCRANGIPMNVPFRELEPDQQRWIIEGDPDYGKDAEHQWPRAWYGVKGYFRWLESKSYKMHVRVLLSRFRVYRTCPECEGRRLKPEALLYRVSLSLVGQGFQPVHVAPDRQDACPTTGFMERSGAVPENDPRREENLSFSLPDFYQFTVARALSVVDRWLSERGGAAPNDPLNLALGEVRSRLNFLNEVGVGYLTLDRPTRSLSGGETERVSLATILGSRLVDTLFVLDEPSVGLHPRDTDRLIQVLLRLRDAGNTVVVVEHEAAVMRAADQIVDLGPGHGEQGGSLVFQGPYEALLRAPSITGRYLAGRQRIPAREPRLVNEQTPRLRLRGVSVNNLRDFAAEIPLGRLVCVTGVSGSGKTTLAREVLLPLLTAKLREASDSTPNEEPADGAESSSEEETVSARPGDGDILGWEALGSVRLVDQAPLGRTPRSNPAVYTGVFEDIRELFARTDLARQRGLNASAFSFNSAQGQCPTCRGAGFEKIEMQFLSDVFVRCPDCQGRRYRPHILEVRLVPGASGDAANESGSGTGILPVQRDVDRLEALSHYQPAPPGSGDRNANQRRTRRARTVVADGSRLASGASIADLLDATIDEVIAFLARFADSRPARRAGQGLRILAEVGLGYLRLGQPINTLSGGESQRLKLAHHLVEFTQARAADSRPALFLFDEPTTGLHCDDVRVLVAVFQRLVDAGHSVLVVEHNLELIACADWVIDLGPEAGDGGGRIVVSGPPAQVADCPASHTGQALRRRHRPFPQPRAGK